MRNLLLLTTSMLILFSSCSVDADRPIQDSELKFTTTDDSELFFQNVRQLYYEVEEIPATKMKVFRNEKLKNEKVRPAIVWNQLYDEAYILLENDLNSSFMITINVQDVQEEFLFENADKSEQLRIATHVYNAIKKNGVFYLKTEEINESFLKSPESKEAFRVMMADYFRLVNIL